MKIPKFFTKNPSFLSNLSFVKFKQNVKPMIKQLEKSTSIEKPTFFILNGDFSFTDKNQDFPLLIIGRPTTFWKPFVKEIIKEPLGVLGLAYFNGKTSDGRTIINLDIAKGTGKTKIDKIDKSLLKILPSILFQVDCKPIDEREFETLQSQLADEGEEIENNEVVGGDEEEQKNVENWLKDNLRKIASQFTKIKIYQNVNTIEIQTEITDLLILVDEWQDFYEVNLQEAQGLGLQEYKKKTQDIEDFLKCFAKNPQIWKNANLIETWGSVGYLLEQKNNAKFIQTLYNLKQQTSLQNHVFRGEYLFNAERTAIKPKGLHHHQHLKSSPPTIATNYFTGDAMLNSSVPSPPQDDKPYKGYFQMFSIEAQNYQIQFGAGKVAISLNPANKYMFGWKKESSTFFPNNWTPEQVIEETAFAFSQLEIKPMPNLLTDPEKYNARINSPSKTCRGLCSKSFWIEFLIPKTQADITNEQLTGAESLSGNEKIADAKTFYPTK